MTAFFDTNILVYAVSDDLRRSRAREVLAEGGIISAQVLNEFVSVLRRKQAQDWHVIEAALAALKQQFSLITPLTEETHAAALALARDHSFSFYDALIVAAAQQARCNALYTQDMQHGREVGGLRIVDPFR